MLMAVGNKSNLAVACQAISRVHCRERRLQEALDSDAIEEAWKQAELSDNIFIQAVVSLTYSMILFTANRDTEAQNHMEIALIRASHFGNRLTVARAFQYMGYGNLRKGDYRNAYDAYEAAVEQYHGNVDAWGETKCKENMAEINRNQGNLDELVGQSLFYQPTPAQEAASDVPISGS